MNAKANAKANTKVNAKVNAKVNTSSSEKQTICYTGVGANKSGLHTDNEFRKLVKTQKICQNNCPKKLDDWIKWYGAGRKSEKTCKNVLKLNKEINILNKKEIKAVDNLKNCIKDKCSYEKEDVYMSGVCVVKKCEKEGKKLIRANKLVNKVADKSSRTWGV